jgi:hypothetical protein
MPSGGAGAQVGLDRLVARSPTRHSRDYAGVIVTRYRAGVSLRSTTRSRSDDLRDDHHFVISRTPERERVVDRKDTPARYRVTITPA